MISGYLNKDKTHAVKSYILALLVPYILLCILYFPFYALYHRHEDFVLDYFYLLLTGRAAWFIPALFLMKMIYIPFVRNYRLGSSIILSFVSFAIAYILYQCTHTFDYHIFRFFPFFILGYVIKREHVNVKVNIGQFLIAVSLYGIAMSLAGGYVELLHFQNVSMLFLFINSSLKFEIKAKPLYAASQRVL